MRTGRPEPHTLSGAYALDALTGADRARFERHLARCQVCAREISGLREATARLAAAAAADPPAGLIERALAAAARTRQLPPRTRDRAAPWPGRQAWAAVSAGPGGLLRVWLPRLALALAGAVLLLAAALGLTARTAQHPTAGDQLHSQTIAAVLTAPDATMLTGRIRDGGTATVVMSGRDHPLVFAEAGLPPLPASRRYQLWLMRPGGDKTLALLLHPRPGVAGPVIASGINLGNRLGLTVEPASGSAHPTTAMILVLTL